MPGEHHAQPLPIEVDLMKCLVLASQIRLEIHYQVQRNNYYNAV